MRRFFWIVLMVIGIQPALWAKKLAVGQPAPSFQGAVSDGSTISLAELLGRPVVLYFFPKSDSENCTAEMCDLHDHFAVVKKLDAQVYGVSYATPAEAKRLAQQSHLPFPIVADGDHKLAHSYGADGLFDLERKVVAIDRKGRIAYIDDNPDPTKRSHALQDVLERL